MSNNADTQKTISGAREWANESDAYVKTLKSEFEKQNSNPSFLKTSFEKLNELIKSGDQHKQSLTNVSKAIKLAQSVPQLTGGQYSDINKHMKEIDGIIQMVQTSHNGLKEFRDKIAKHMDKKI